MKCQTTPSVPPLPSDYNFAVVPDELPQGVVVSPAAGGNTIGDARGLYDSSSGLLIDAGATTTSATITSALRD